MCGFVGYINKEKDKKDNIKKMADLIAHRGPDSEGYYTDENIALGFRRLSIIDLNNGSQPIYNEDKSKVIIFNGEIYNFEPLREDLIKKGHTFTTKTDTEVILHGYEEYGEKILDKLRGMFAFVIYDKNTKELFAARDFYGIKPFYYAKMGNTLIFGSEIKSFLIHPHFKKELNSKMLEYYLTFQYSPGNETFFKNVYKLMPGHYLKYKNGKLEVKKYYEIKFKEDKTKTYDEWKKGIKQRLADSIKAHKISDVEVGSFLSSGVDSSFIAASSDVDKTFTVGFNNEKYSEISYAKDLSEKINTQNISKVITKEEYFKKLPNIIYYMDEPVADPSAIALYFVTELASENVKVSLSGEGADEIFGGYNIYQEPLTDAWYYKLPYPIRFVIGKVASIFPHKRGINFLIRRGKKLEDRFVGNAFIFNNHEVKKILKNKRQTKGFQDLTKPYYEKVKDKDEVTKMQYIDFNFWLIGDILTKADKMSMANSLEVRVPFLDRPLIDYALGLPTEFKTDKNTTKKIFRDIASEVLEDKVSTKKKLGFPVPIRVWLKEDETYESVRKVFMQDNKFFNQKAILKLLDDHKKGKADNSRKIWTIYVFLIWYEIFFGGNK
ncbi:MAG TPA: asparagine synthase (glutamine-hydrolyzing) [Candidatus Coprosoma intestinipullorum]|uniref:asparagine synthase (glutamine-hydrolyzing) n=1 Tax=Candidatus Coprosoma intestinipullorum TaxID=2840752 RepID=A0A9D0ZTJ6_9FIRM|nr:asparagine synthase (glutamine-hydrolyzing) [Candidatus Coprosoma intestinipullorum]